MDLPFMAYRWIGFLMLEGLIEPEMVYNFSGGQAPCPVEISPESFPSFLIDLRFAYLKLLYP
jgi:hypothetical protein